MDITQMLSLAGAFFILAAFAAQNFGWINGQSLLYQSLNLIGALLLTYTAWVGRQYGFILLEGVWSFISLYGIWRIIRV